MDTKYFRQRFKQFEMGHSYKAIKLPFFRKKSIDKSF